jgi:predicted GIY-YIG superfamily endonuclease
MEFPHNVAMWYVYILQCTDSKPYTGCTDDLKDRIKRHHAGYVPATKNRRPVNLKSYFAFQDKYIAFDFEKYLKSGSGRAFAKKHNFY